MNEAAGLFSAAFFMDNNFPDGPRDEPEEHNRLWKFAHDTRCTNRMAD